MAYEVFAGQVPFSGGDSRLSIMLRHVNEPVPPAWSVNPEGPANVSDWIERLLAKDPADRPPTAEQAWDEFEEILVDAVGHRWTRASRIIDATGPDAPDIGTRDEPSAREAGTDEQVAGPATPRPPGETAGPLLPHEIGVPTGPPTPVPDFRAFQSPPVPNPHMRSEHAPSAPPEHAEAAHDGEGAYATFEQVRSHRPTDVGSRPTLAPNTRPSPTPSGILRAGSVRTTRRGRRSIAALVTVVAAGALVAAVLTDGGEERALKSGAARQGPWSTPTVVLGGSRATLSGLGVWATTPVALRWKSDREDGWAVASANGWTTGETGPNIYALPYDGGNAWRIHERVDVGIDVATGALAAPAGVFQPIVRTPVDSWVGAANAAGDLVMAFVKPGDNGALLIGSASRDGRVTPARTVAPNAGLIDAAVAADGRGVVAWATVDDIRAVQIGRDGRIGAVQRFTLPDRETAHAVAVRAGLDGSSLVGWMSDSSKRVGVTVLSADSEARTTTVPWLEHDSDLQVNDEEVDLRLEALPGGGGVMTWEGKLPGQPTGVWASLIDAGRPKQARLLSSPTASADVVGVTTDDNRAHAVMWLQTERTPTTAPILLAAYGAEGRWNIPREVVAARGQLRPRAPDGSLDFHPCTGTLTAAWLAPHPDSVKLTRILASERRPLAGARRAPDARSRCESK